MEITVLSGEEATERLRDKSFVDAWERLCTACAWATGYQSPAFILPWYESYADTAEPLLLVAKGADQAALDAVLALAIDRNSGELLNAGGHQAEYHCWIARHNLSDHFIASALALLRERYPKGSLRFRYLPPDSPLGWLGKHSGLRKLVEQRNVPRPLMAIGSEDEIAAKLRKKGNKSRINRLRDACGGELTSHIVTSEADLAELIDEIAGNYDRRQEAMNQVRPFGDDSRKKDFHLRLLRSGVLHAFVLRAGETMVAAILSVKSKGFLSVGVLSHSDALSQFSPGKFGMLYLGREAVGEGYHTIDLTPGGEWKDRFATDHDSVTELTIRFSAMQATVVALREQALASTKQLLAAAGVTPQDLRRLRARFRPAAQRQDGESEQRRAS